MNRSKVLFWYTAAGLSRYHAAANVNVCIGGDKLITAHCGRHAIESRYLREMNLLQFQKRAPSAKVRCINCERKLRRVANERE